MPELTPERWQQVERVMRAALACPQGTRGALLDRECGDDKVLRSEVESLLAASSEAGDFMEQAPVAINRRPLGPEQNEVPAEIGGYRVVRQIGAGGMGVVYLAEQNNPRRKVAIKVMRMGTGAGNRARFAREADALGRLKHPGIAQIYEARQATIDGTNQAFIAMEYVEGETLTDFVTKAALDVKTKLALFARICDGVQHAHQKGVVHRDLKPSNILVHHVPDSSEPPMPKVLDFGIARITDEDSSAMTLSSPKQLIGTVLYMSPEQIEGDLNEIDTRSDVYALGVVGYELLCGRLPCGNRGMSAPECIRAITESLPRRLGEIDPRYKGDLETIFARALEKETRRRYVSAAALADDIRRFLKHEPITARPPSAMYQFRMFARRNRGLVTGATMAVVGLLVGISFAAWQAIEANRGRERAEKAESLAASRLTEITRTASVTESVVEFLTGDVLAAAAPDQLGPQATVREAVDAAAARIDQRFPDQPDIEAGVRLTLGRTYAKLGLPVQAESHLLPAMKLVRESMPDDIAASIEVRKWLAEVLDDQGRFEESARLCLRNVEAAEAAFGADSPHTLIQMDNLAHSHQRHGRLDEARRIYEEVLTKEASGVHRATDERLTTLGNLATLYVQMGQLDKAAPMLQDAADVSEAFHGPDHPDTLIWLANLAYVQTHRKQYDLAEPLLKELLTVRRRVLGDEHPDTLDTLNNLASLYLRMAAYDRAFDLYAELLELRERVQGPEHFRTLTTLNNMGMVFLRQGDPVKAEPYLVRAVETGRRVVPGDSLDLGMWIGNLGKCLLKQRRFAEAEPRLLEAQKILNTLVGESHPYSKIVTELLSELNAKWTDRDSAD